MQSEVAVQEPAVSHLPLCLSVESPTHTSFSEKQYAPVEIVQTERKGFGLRAAADIPSCVPHLIYAGMRLILAGA